MHTSEGTLRAYLDGELDSAQIERMAAHLRECAACRAQLEELAARSAAARHAVELLAPHSSELPAPASMALARFKQAAAASGRAHSIVPEGVVTMFSKKYRPLWTVAAIVAVIALSLSFAPVRVAAGQFLALFRVRQFAVVPINPTALQHLDSAAVQQQMAQMFSDDVKVLHEPGDPVQVASAEEASQKAGVQVRLPAALGTPSSIEVQDGLDLTYKFNAERAHALLETMGRSDIKIPAGLDGAMISVNIKPIVMAQYGTGSQAFGLIQANSPVIDMPPGVDVNSLGATLLQLWGMSPAEASQAAAKIDWASTLVIPVPTNMASYQDVTVDGSPGLFLEQTAPEHGPQMYTLLWQKNDVVYALIGQGTLDRALQIVSSMK